MTESHDAPALWPASPYDLADRHRCPSCFAVVSAAVCTACGFALFDPRAPRVLELGREILATELARRRLIDDIRLATAPAPLAVLAEEAVTDASPEAAAPIPEPVLADAVPAGAFADLGLGPVAAPVTPTALAAPIATARSAGRSAEDAPSAAPAKVEASTPRRRLTVPVLLLIVGVSLVGVAAVFFLLLAWFVAGIAVRALIIGGITLATIALASWLRRRTLTATAEGIGALGVVLLALDAWAVRANDLFGAGSGDAAVYAGCSALVVAAVCRLWARASGLRGPDLAASVALPAGVGLLVGGLTSMAPAEAVTAGLLGAAAGGLVHALPAPWSAARAGAAGAAERLVLALCGVGALVAAGMTTSLLTGDAVAVVVWSSTGLIVLGAAHAWLAHRSLAGDPLPAARIVSGVGSAVAVAAAGVAGWQLAWRTGLPLHAVLIAPVLAALVAFVVDVARTRRPSSLWRPAAITSVAIATLSTVGTAIGWGVQAGEAIAGSWTVWRTDAFTLPVTAPEAPLLAVVAAAAIGALMLLAPTLRRADVRDAAPVIAGVLLLVAAARTAVPAVIVGVGAAMAVGVVAILAIRRRRSRRGDGVTRNEAERPHAGLMVAGGIAVVAAYLGGVATPWLWVVGIALAMAYPVALRVVVRPADGAAVAAAVAPVAVAALSTLFAPDALAAATGSGGSAADVTLALLGWVALAALVAAIALRVDRASRSALTVAAATLAVIDLAGTVITATIAGVFGFAPAPLTATIGEPVLGIVRNGLLLVALAAIALGRTRVGGGATVFAAALTAPVAAVTVFSALSAAGVSRADWAPLALTAAAVAVPLVGAVATLARHTAPAEAPVSPASPALESAGRSRPGTVRRLAADLGAVAAVLVVWEVGSALWWAALGLVALGFAAASVTAGWIAPAGDPADDQFATRRNGMPLIEAPRRLLAWPALASALAAWWAWLGDAVFTDGFAAVEAYVVPAAVAFVGFAAVLVRLRRRLEASIALAAGLMLGLWTPAIAGWVGEPLRGMITALIAAGLCLALAFTPLRGIRPVAPVGAAVGVAAIALVSVERAGAGPEWQLLWLGLVAVAYAAGAGIAATRPSRPSSRLFALVVPPVALVVAVAEVVPLAGEPSVAAGALIVLAALHLTSAGIDRAPLTAPTRWIALGGAAAVGGSAWFLGAVTAVEAVSLPVAAMCLAGAVLSMLRRRRGSLPWPAAEAAAWIAGLVLATVPSLLVPTEPWRVWMFLTIVLAGAALAAAAAALPAARAAGGLAAETLRTPTAIVLGAAALAMGFRGVLTPGFDAGPAAAIVVAVGALAIGVLLTATASADRPAHGAAWLAGGAAALLVILALTHPDAGLPATTVIAVIGGAVGVGGAAVLGLRRWSALGGVLAAGGLLVALAACGTRFQALASDPGAGFEPDLWAIAGAGITGAIALAALRATPSRAVGQAAGAGLAVGVVLFTAAELQLLLFQDVGDGIRTVLVMAALTAAAAVGVAARERLGRSLAIAATVAGVIFGLVALVAFGVRPIELVTVPPALGGIAYAVRSLRRDPSTRTWPALGPWLALLTVPSLLQDFGDAALWRIVTLGVIAIAMVAVGAVYRLQAPLVLGSAVLLTHAVAQLWPWISQAYAAVPWWLWLGLGGALLIFIAARYEKRMRALRTAFSAVTSLR